MSNTEETDGLLTRPTGCIYTVSTADTAARKGADATRRERAQQERPQRREGYIRRGKRSGVDVSESPGSNSERNTKGAGATRAAVAAEGK